MLRMCNLSYDGGMVENGFSEHKEKAISVVADWASRIGAGQSSHSAWATSVGLSSTTVTRGMGEKSTTTPKLESLHALARKAGVPSVLDFLAQQQLDQAEIGEVIDQRINESYDNAITDALAALEMLLLLAKVDHGTSASIVRALPTIAQAGRDAREGGYDQRTAVATIARHMFSQSNPEGQSQ